MSKFKNIQFIINPVSGISRPILQPLTKALQAAPWQWDIAVTKKAEEATELTQKAINAKVDAVAVVGGDGTVMEVASQLVGTEIPLIILPTGSANILAVETGIPTNFLKVLEFVYKSRYKIRKIDMGKIGSHYFLLRLSSGFEAEIVKAADRSLKSKVGWLAYAFSGFKALLSTKPTVYQFNLDGKEVECEGVSYVIANSGNIGLPGISFSPKIKVDDGLLDVLIIRAADLKRLFAAVAEKRDQDIVSEFFQHWQVRNVSVKANPTQTIQCDGEIWHERNINIEIVPQALNIVVPRRYSYFNNI